MQPGGINLSLKKMLCVSIWWQGRGGLALRKLKNHIRLLMRLEDTPEYVVIHIGGNDIGDIRASHFHYFAGTFYVVACTDDATNWVDMVRNSTQTNLEIFR